MLSKPQISTKPLTTPAAPKLKGQEFTVHNGDHILLEIPSIGNSIKMILQSASGFLNTLLSVWVLAFALAPISTPTTNPSTATTVNSLCHYKGIWGLNTNHSPSSHFFPAFFFKSSPPLPRRFQRSSLFVKKNLGYSQSLSYLLILGCLKSREVGLWKPSYADTGRWLRKRVRVA